LNTGEKLLLFGFSKCKKGDQFSKKYGREQAYLRANNDPRAITVVEDFRSASFLDIAKVMVDQIDHVTDWGKSLLSPLTIEHPL